MKSGTSALVELVRELETLHLDGPEPFAPFVERLSAMWGAQALAYRPLLAGERWEAEFVHSEGFIPGARFVAGVREYLASAPVSWALYNPLRPEPKQRNTVWGDRELPPPEQCARTVHAVAHFYKRIGIFGLSQLRTLVCDGPVLLAWVGGFRERPFSDVERDELAQLIEPLRQRLLIERLLSDHGATAAGVTAALDQIASPALIVRDDARVEHANEAALRLFEREGIALLGRVRRAIAAPAADPSLVLTPIASAGTRRHFLAVLRGEATNVELRMALFRTRWQLTPRQAEVLQMLVRGEPNKGIAEKLELSEATVELHVTALLRKARVENRASLVARFWTES